MHDVFSLCVWISYNPVLFGSVSWHLQMGFIDSKEGKDRIFLSYTHLKCIEREKKKKQKEWKAKEGKE